MILRTDDMVPTLTCSNSTLWLYGLGEGSSPRLHRFLEPAERALLQGLDPKMLAGLTRAQAVHATGNAYPVPMVATVLNPLLRLAMEYRAKFKGNEELPAPGPFHYPSFRLGFKRQKIDDELLNPPKRQKITGVYIPETRTLILEGRKEPDGMPNQKRARWAHGILKIQKRTLKDYFKPVQPQPELELVIDV